MWMIWLPVLNIAYSFWLFLQICTYQYSHVRWWHSLAVSVGNSFTRFVAPVIDLFISRKKCGCVQTGPHCNNVCCDIVSSYGYVLQSVDSIRYFLWVHLVRAKDFKCNFDNWQEWHRRSYSPADQFEMYDMLIVCIRCLSVNKTQQRSLGP